MDTSDCYVSGRPTRCSGMNPTWSSVWFQTANWAKCLLVASVPSLATASQSAIFSFAPTTFLIFCQLANNDLRLAVKSAQLSQHKGFVCFLMMSEEETSAFLEEVKATGLVFHLSSNHNLTCGTATTWMTEKLHRPNFCQSKTFKWWRYNLILNMKTWQGFRTVIKQFLNMEIQEEHLRKQNYKKKRKRNTTHRHITSGIIHFIAMRTSRGFFSVIFLKPEMLLKLWPCVFL